MISRVSRVAINPCVEVETRGDIGIIWADNPPVNALNWTANLGLRGALDHLLADDATRAIVMACRGRTFFAGADIREFGQPAQGSGPRPDPVGTVARAGKPVVAAIFGTAFGGGLEIALCCHGRVAVRGTRFALPEVKIGILPGASGGQRLARLIGVEKALDITTSGDPIDGEEALACGLVDALVPDAELVERAVEHARALADRGSLRRVDELDETFAVVRSDPEFFSRYRAKIAARTRGQEAPERIVQVLEATVMESGEAGLHVQRTAFAELVRSAQARALRHYFFAERTAAKVPDVPPTTPQRPVRSVGVIGAGTMGGGIAMCFANVGIPAIIVERDEAALTRGLTVVRRNYERSAQRGRFSAAEVEARMGRITGALRIEALADCDLVIEAVFENMGLKQELFARLDAVCKPGAILASNTSGLDLNQIAAATRRPADVIGMHFFSPANVMKLLEVVRGRATSKDVIATAMSIGKTIGKVPALVGVCPGFVGNRMLARRGWQSQRLLLQGALPWDIDRVLYDFGFPMGPFAMSDLAGLDIGWNAAKSKGETIRDRLCEMGRRGQKTNAGYYNYDPETRARTPEPKVAALIAQFAREKGMTPRQVDDTEILERCLMAMINEGAKILQEGIAIRASDIDVIWVNGYGWPSYRGGPMYYADQLGLAHVVAALRRFEQADKDAAWPPAPLLTRLATEGKTFADLATG